MATSWHRERMGRPVHAHIKSSNALLQRLRWGHHLIDAGKDLSQAERRRLRRNTSEDFVSTEPRSPLNVHLRQEREERARRAKEEADANFREPRKSHESSLGGVSLNRLTEALDRHDKTRSGRHDVEQEKKTRLTSLGRNLSMVADGIVTSKVEQDRVARVERDQEADAAAGLGSRASKGKGDTGSKGGSKSGGGSKTGRGGGGGDGESSLLTLNGPLADHAPVNDDAYANKDVQYERGSVIYYGSQIALCAKLHGGYLCMDGTRGCMASAPGLQPHALFTVWNIDELTGYGALRYGDSVWLQCGSHELLGSSVLMQDLGDLVEAAVSDYHAAIDNIHNQHSSEQGAKQADHRPQGHSDLQQQNDREGEGGVRVATKVKVNRRALKGLRDKPTPDTLHSGFHVVGGELGQGPSRVVGQQHMSSGGAAASNGARKGEERYQGRLVSLHCTGEFLTKAKHAGRWVLMNRADPLGTLGKEICHLDDIVVEQEWLYLASKNPDRAGLKHGSSMEALHERQKVGGVVGQAASAISLSNYNSDKRSPQEEMGEEQQQQQQQQRPSFRDAPEKHVLSECVWTVHIAKLASSSTHEVQRLGLATHAQKQLEASRAHRKAVERGVGLIQAEKYREAQMMTLEHMHGPDARAIQLVDHLRRSYHSRATRGWHNDAPLLSTESLAEVYGSTSIFRRTLGDAKDEMKRRLDNAYVKPPDIKHVNDRERARILASLSGLESGIKSEHHMALTYERTKNQMKEQMMTLRAAHIILRAWRRFQTFKWKRILGDADQNMINEVRQEKIDKAKREKLNQDAAEKEQTAWKAESERTLSNGAEMPSTASMRRIISMSRLTSLESRFAKKGSTTTTLSNSAILSPTAQHHKELQQRLSEKRLMNASAKRLSSPKMSMSSSRAFTRSARAGSGSAGESVRGGSKDQNQMNDLDDFLQNAASPVEDEEDNESTFEASNEEEDSSMNSAEVDDDDDDDDEYDDDDDADDDGSSLTYGEPEFPIFEELVRHANEGRAGRRGRGLLSHSEEQLVEELGLTSLQTDLELTDEERLRFLADENPALFGGFRMLDIHLNRQRRPGVEGDYASSPVLTKAKYGNRDYVDSTQAAQEEELELEQELEYKIAAEGGFSAEALLLETVGLSPDARNVSRSASAPRQIYTGARQGRRHRRKASGAPEDAAADAVKQSEGVHGFVTPQESGEEELQRVRPRPQSASAVSAAKQQQQRRLQLSMPTSPVPAGPSTTALSFTRDICNIASPIVSEGDALHRQRPHSAGAVSSSRRTPAVDAAPPVAGTPHKMAKSASLFTNPRWKPQTVSAIHISSVSRAAMARTEQRKECNTSTGVGHGQNRTKPRPTTVSAKSSPHEEHQAFHATLKRRRQLREQKQRQQQQQQRRKQLQRMVATESTSSLARPAADPNPTTQGSGTRRHPLSHSQGQSASARRLLNGQRSAAQQRGRYVHRENKR